MTRDLQPETLDLCQCAALARLRRAQAELGTFAARAASRLERIAFT